MPTTCKALHPFCDDITADVDTRCPIGGLAAYYLGADELRCCRPWGHEGDHAAYRPHVMFRGEPRAVVLPFYAVRETWHQTPPAAPRASYSYQN
jgi:hypothetical protein